MTHHAPSRTTVLLAGCALAFMLFAVGTAVAQNQLDSAPYTPGVDADIDLYMRSWTESMPRHYHGSLILRDIFIPGDPMNPPRRGSVLRWFSLYAHATLEGGATTTPVALAGEQEVYYILSGTGTISGGGDTFPLYKGMCAFIPEKITYSVTADSGEPLIMLLIAEPIPSGFESKTAIFVRDENVTPYTMTDAHWTMAFKDVMNGGDGMVRSSVILAVTFLPMTLGHPHSHEGLFQEMWLCLEGETQVLLGKQVRDMPPGTAYLVPPDGKTPHSNINVSDKPVKLFHLRRHLDAFDGTWDGFSPRN
jgi:mannose-6-phosphate isomerase-like protein (cupin superfamily)